MVIKLFHMERYVGELEAHANTDPRPGDYITFESKGKTLRYSVKAKEYQYDSNGQEKCLLLHVHPANAEAQAHVVTAKKKRPYTQDCPECSRAMLKMHAMKKVETWRCSSCSHDVVESREEGIIEITAI